MEDGKENVIVGFERKLSQVDKSVEEEIVTPVQITSNSAVHHNHSEQSTVVEETVNHNHSEQNTVVEETVNHSEQNTVVEETVNHNHSEQNTVVEETVNHSEQNTVVEETVNHNHSEQNTVVEETVQTSSISVTEMKSDIKIIRQDTYTVGQENIGESNTESEYKEELKEIDHHNEDDNNEDLGNSKEPERHEENQNETQSDVDNDPIVEEQDEVDDCSFTSSVLQRQNTYTVKTVEMKESSSDVLECFSEEQRFVEYKYDDEGQEEPLYKEPDDDLESSEPSESGRAEVRKVEDQYVTAEEVRSQKHRVMGQHNVTEVTTRGEPTIMEETSLASLRPQSDLKDPEDGLERTSRDVDQLLKDIRDPNLDCSLEDIEAMIDGKNLNEVKEESMNRGSPEFAKAATLIDQNPDKGFDPEDPAVKGLEDWECSNLATSFDSEESKPSKLKNVFKRMSRTEETRSLLNESLNNNNFEKLREEDDDKISPGCFGTTLLYIFLKIFD